MKQCSNKQIDNWIVQENKDFLMDGRKDLSTYFICHSTCHSFAPSKLLQGQYNVERFMSWPLHWCCADLLDLLYNICCHYFQILLDILDLLYNILRLLRQVLLDVLDLLHNILTCFVRSFVVLAMVLCCFFAMSRAPKEIGTRKNFKAVFMAGWL